MRRIQSLLLNLRRPRLIVRTPLWLLAITLSTIACPTACSAQKKTITKATTSRAAREDAIRGIPFRSLNPNAQRRIASVVKKPTMFRRMPITAIQCDPEIHRFSVRHPEVIVDIWQLMGITQVTAQRTGPYMLKCDDGVGTVTNLELIYGDSETHVLFCEGSYDGPLFRKPLTGRCVLVLKSGAQKTGTVYQVTNMLDVFLQVDHAGIDIFAKTLHPLLGKSADVNFMESMRFVERLSHASQINPEGMQHMIGRLQHLQPTVRQQFQQVVANVDGRHKQTIANRATPSTAIPVRGRQTPPARATSRPRPGTQSR